MRAGDLSHRIDVDEPLTTQDDAGGEIVTWPMVGTVWGAIEPLNGHEGLIAGGIGSTLRTRIRLRWSPNVDLINATWRLRHAGVIYNIIERPAHIKLRRREIHCMCESGINEG